VLTLNVASRKPIALEALMAHIETACQRRALYATRAGENNVSPYGLADDWFMDVSKCESLGFQAPPITEWLSGLIEWTSTPLFSGPSPLSNRCP
jgi:hypothetical protein